MITRYLVFLLFQRYNMAGLRGKPPLSSIPHRVDFSPDLRLSWLEIGRQLGIDRAQRSPFIWGFISVPPPGRHCLFVRSGFLGTEK